MTRSHLNGDRLESINGKCFQIYKKKQIDYGKVTVDYEEYLDAVPKSQRGPSHPRTPEKFQKTSRRGFDSQIKSWKIKIHNWKGAEEKGELSQHKSEK